MVLRAINIMDLIEPFDGKIRVLEYNPVTNYYEVMDNHDCRYGNVLTNPNFIRFNVSEGKIFVLETEQTKEQVKKSSDPVNSPAHYQGKGMEVLDVARAFLTRSQLTGAYIFNIVKYCLRYKSKNGVQDLEKAMFYLKELIDLEKTEGDHNEADD